MERVGDDLLFFYAFFLLILTPDVVCCESEGTPS